MRGGLFQVKKTGVLYRARAKQIMMEREAEKKKKKEKAQRGRGAGWQNRGRSAKRRALVVNSEADEMERDLDRGGEGRQKYECAEGNRNK